MIGRFSNRYFAHKFLSFFWSIFHRNKHITFYAPVKFHALHLLPIIEELISRSELKISLVGCFDDFPQLKSLPLYNSLNSLPIHQKYHAFIMTEIDLPWALQGKLIFFGHGIGPKLTYQSGSGLNSFDAIFSPCEAIFNAQRDLPVQLFKVGLPLLDNLKLTSKKKELIENKFQLNKNLPTIIYAPSWHSDNSLISNIKNIVAQLTLLKLFNVIISPHPNLLNPEKYTDIHIFDQLNIQTNTPDTGISTLDLCLHAQIVISDISSILFEAMAIQKCTLLDGNEHVYKESGAEDILIELKHSIPTLDWSNDIEQQLLNAYSNPSDNQAQYIQNYLYNNGDATSAFINALKESI